MSSCLIIALLLAIIAFRSKSYVKIATIISNKTFNKLSYNKIRKIHCLATDKTTASEYLNQLPLKAIG